MPYSYCEHVSDIGIRAEGPDLKSAFSEGVSAMLNVMFDASTIGEGEVREILAEAPEIETLFVEVLNEVLSIQGLDELAFKRIETFEIERTAGGFRYSGIAFGEKFDRARHGARTEVKGATYSGLKYNHGANGTHALECILDV
ncbi:MAG: archease [Deltaproteobacteria bacterium]|nr:archease [Deltaproteobacteria bacterium]